MGPLLCKEALDVLVTWRREQRLKPQMYRTSKLLVAVENSISEGYHLSAGIVLRVVVVEQADYEVKRGEERFQF